jgi:4-amino-4-deoxy-L-arabinose transferase-like glycosyltransferase
MSSARSKPYTLDPNIAGATASPSSRPTFSMVLTACVAFFVALSIYFAVTESPGRINHDMSEAFAWGREFQLGYAQHPPFWAWLCGAWFLVFPHEIWAFGILSSLNATIGLFGAWLLIGDFAEGHKRSAATALLLLMPCYTFLAFKYDANIIFISLWPLTAHYFLRAIDGGRWSDSAAFGAFAGLSLMSKYYALILLASCFLAALQHPRRKAYFASASPFLSAALAAAICAPHLAWLLNHRGTPVRYLASMSGLTWSAMAGYAAETLFGALKMNVVMIAVVALAARTTPSDWIASWRRRAGDPRFRMLVVLALAPLILTFVSAFALRTRIYAEMIVPIFPLLPLLAIECFAPPDLDRLWSIASRLAAAVVVGGVALSPAIAAATIYWSANAMKIAPYREVAFEATRLWREQTGRPMVYVASKDSYEAAAAFYSPDRPHAFIKFDYDRSPWVTPESLADHGLLSICGVDDRACLEATAEFASPQSKPTEISLAHAAWGHIAKTFHYIVTVIPPRS